MLCLNISDLLARGLMDADALTLSVSCDGELVAALQYDRERQAVRVVSILPKSRKGGEDYRDEYIRVVWKPSNLGRGGYWYFVTWTGRRARKIYRGRGGWAAYADIADRVIYKSQTKSDAQRNARPGRGFVGQLRRAIAESDLLEMATEPYRKERYNGKLTPYGRRLRREFARIYGRDAVEAAE